MADHRTMPFAGCTKFSVRRCVLWVPLERQPWYPAGQLLSSSKIGPLLNQLLQAMVPMNVTNNVFIMDRDNSFYAGKGPLSAPAVTWHGYSPAYFQKNINIVNSTRGMFLLNPLSSTSLKVDSNLGTHHSFQPGSMVGRHTLCSKREANSWAANPRCEKAANVLVGFWRKFGQLSISGQRLVQFDRPAQRLYFDIWWWLCVYQNILWWWRLPKLLLSEFCGVADGRGSNVVTCPR